jgi:hypothetical protein
MEEQVPSRGELPLDVGGQLSGDGEHRLDRPIGLLTDAAVRHVGPMVDGGDSEEKRVGTSAEVA